MFGKRICVKIIIFVSVSIFNVFNVILSFIFVFVWFFALSCIVCLVWCFDSVDLVEAGEWCCVICI